MLYLIEPHGRLRSAETTLGDLRARQKMGGGFRRIVWRTAPQLLHMDDYVDLALRHGVTAQTGLILDESFVEHARRPAELRAQQANQERVAAQLAGISRDSEDRSMRLHDRRALHDGADRDLARRLEKAEDKAREILQADIQSELVLHWKALGGTLPQATRAELLADED